MDKMVKRLTKIKEYMDIVSERNELFFLWNTKNIIDLREHLNTLCYKYPVEVSIYNMTHPIPSQSIEGSAMEAMDFLDGLLKAKTLDLRNTLFMTY